MTDLRRPVLPLPAPACQRGGCSRPAEWLIRNLDGETLACSAHVGELLGPMGNAVLPVCLATRKAP